MEYKTIFCGDNATVEVDLSKEDILLVMRDLMKIIKAQYPTQRIASLALKGQVSTQYYSLPMLVAATYCEEHDCIVLGVLTGFSEEICN